MSMVADNYTIINTQGIRFVEKIDREATNFGRELYRLRVTYKGAELDYGYPDKATRDTQYEAIRIALGISRTSLGDALEPAKASSASEAP
jgi:hypothetical protein